MAEQTKEASGPSTSPGLRGASKNPAPGDAAAAGSGGAANVPPSPAVGALSLPSPSGGGGGAAAVEPPRWCAPVVSSIDSTAKATGTTPGVTDWEANEPLTTLGLDGVFYIRGKQYKLEGEPSTGTRSNVYCARCVAEQPDHDVRDPRNKIDRINPPLNKDLVAVKIFRCDELEKTELEKYEADRYYEHEGRCINAGSTTAEAARREIEMYKLAQFYTASEKRSSGIQLLAETPIKYGETEGPVRAAGGEAYEAALRQGAAAAQALAGAKELLEKVANKWLPGFSKGDAQDPEKVSKARFVMMVTEYATQGTLEKLIIDQTRELNERQCKWVLIDVLEQARRMHKHKLVFNNWNDPSSIVFDHGEARVVSFHRTRHAGNGVADTPRNAAPLTLSDIQDPTATGAGRTLTLADHLSTAAAALARADAGVTAGLAGAPAGGSGGAKPGDAADGGAGRGRPGISDGDFLLGKDNTHDNEAGNVAVVSFAEARLAGGAARPVGALSLPSSSGGGGGIAAMFTVGMIGGTSFQAKDQDVRKPELKKICEKLSELRQPSASHPQINLKFLTGGEDGWEPQTLASEAFGKGMTTADQTASIFHLCHPFVADDGRSAMGIGTTVPTGWEYHSRRAVFGNLCDAYIVCGGGPGTINEAMHALVAGKTVIPIYRTGGAASGMFKMPHIVKPDAIASGDWETIRGLEGGDDDIAEAVKNAISALAQSPPGALAQVSDAAGLTSAPLGRAVTAGDGLSGDYENDIQDIGRLAKAMLCRTLPNDLTDGWTTVAAAAVSQEARDFVDKLIGYNLQFGLDDCFDTFICDDPWLKGQAEAPVDAYAVPPRVTVYRSGQFADLERQLLDTGDHASGIAAALQLPRTTPAQVALIPAELTRRLKQLEHPSVETLRAPPIASIDCEANPAGIGNRPITELKADGEFFILGIKYTLDTDGYLGGGAFGRVWTATRVIDAANPLRFERDEHDRINPLLNAEKIAVKLLKTHNAAKKAAARREIEIHARADHYVPGVLALLATATDVRLTGKEWGVAPGNLWEGTPGATRDNEILSLPRGRSYTLLACELANKGKLTSWTKHIDGGGFGRKTGAIRYGATGGISPDGVDFSAFSTMRAQGPGIPTNSHSILARGCMARLFIHLKEQHEHGIVHIDIKSDNLCVHFDGEYHIDGIRLNPSHGIRSIYMCSFGYVQRHVGAGGLTPHLRALSQLSVLPKVMCIVLRFVASGTKYPGIAKMRFLDYGEARALKSLPRYPGSGFGTTGYQDPCNLANPARLITEAWDVYSLGSIM